MKCNSANSLKLLENILADFTCDLKPRLTESWLFNLAGLTELVKHIRLLTMVYKQQWLIYTIC